MKRFFALSLMLFMIIGIAPLSLAGELMKATKITKIEIFNADITPVLLEYPDDHLDFEIDEDEERYWDADHYWYDVTNGTDDIDYFDNKSSYALFWEIDCDSDYEFSTSPTIKINGSDSCVDKNKSKRDEDDPTIFYIWTKAQKAVDSTPSVIKFVDLTNVNTRIAIGDRAAQHMSCDLPSNPQFSLLSKQWFDSDGEVMASTDVFEENKSYYFAVTLQANGSCTFADFAYVTINGSDGLIGSAYVDDENEAIFHIETVAVTPLDRSTLAKVFLLINEDAGATGLIPGLYNVDVHNGDMAYIAPLTFQFFCLEEIDGYYYGYDYNGAFHIVNAETNSVEYNYNNPGVAIVDLAYNTDDDMLYGIDFDTKALYRLELEKGKGTMVYQFNFSPITLAYADGYFYVGSYNNGRTFKLDLEKSHLELFTNVTEIRRAKYAQTMAYSYEDDCLWTYVCGEDDGCLVRIEMDGSYSIEQEFGIIQYTGLMFRRPELPEYTVTFVDGLTDEIIGEQIVKEGRDVTFPAPPFHAGYVFTGWDDDGTDVQSDVTITALYDVKTFTITYVDGYTDEIISEEEVEFGANANFPEPPDHEDEGYRFREWDSDGIDIRSDMQITALYEKIPEQPEIIIGDLNGDGKVNTADAAIVLKFAAGIVTLDADMQKAGDCNHDGKVNTADATLILKYAAGMITGF